MTSTSGARYLTDENTLGPGKLMQRSGRSDVLYPGHDDIPAVPLSTQDLEWMPVVAQRNLIVITRDRRIRTRPAELRVYGSTASGRSGSAPSTTLRPETNSNSSPSTKTGYGEPSSNTVPACGLWPCHLHA